MAVCHEVFRWPEKANWGATNFTGGVGGFQMAPCGALSSSAAVLGLMFGKDADTQEQVKEGRAKCRAAARRVFEEFKKEFGAILCRELVQCDFDQPGAFQRFANEGGFQQKCDRYVGWVVKQVLKIAEEQGVEPSSP